MKKINTLSVSFFIAHIAFSQTVSVDSAAKYSGKTITICSKVLGTHVSSGEHKTTYLNFGKPYPDNTFTVIIHEDNLKNFKYSPSEFLQNKNVCITGTVKIYKDKPEMEVTKEDEIKLK